MLRTRITSIKPILKRRDRKRGTEGTEGEIRKREERVFGGETRWGKGKGGDEEAAGGNGGEM